MKLQTAKTCVIARIENDEDAFFSTLTKPRPTTTSLHRHPKPKEYEPSGVNFGWYARSVKGEQ